MYNHQSSLIILLSTSATTQQALHFGNITSTSTTQEDKTCSLNRYKPCRPVSDCIAETMFILQMCIRWTNEHQQFIFVCSYCCRQLLETLKFHCTLSYLPHQIFNTNSNFVKSKLNIVAFQQKCSILIVVFVVQVSFEKHTLTCQFQGCLTAT